MPAAAITSRTRPRKGDQTREMILERAAVLFNEKGYYGASLADIMAATGLQKGGLYNHFTSKEQLAVEAFNFSLRAVVKRLRERLEGRKTAAERLRAVVEFYHSYTNDPPVRGGCPVMNLAIENDDGNPELRQRAREAMDWMRDYVRRTTAKGIEMGEFRPDINADEVATVILSTVQGALLVSKLYGNGVHLERAMKHLYGYIEDLRVET